MKFSIAIPAYKATFLQECINSILSQTYANFELIIVNDASPENLDDIVLSYTDSRIRYYTNEKNCGAIDVVDNWNKCLSNAIGEYFILMGDDDKLTPNCLEEYLKLIGKYPKLDVYHCKSFIIDENSDVIGFTPSWPEFESMYENIWHRISGFRQQFISDFLYRTSALKQIGGFVKLKLAWASDDITSFELAKEKGIAHTQFPAFCYRRSAITISSSPSAGIKMQAIKQEKDWYNKLIAESTPISELDQLYLKMIEQTLPQYFRRKKIETIAYNGINNGSSIFDLLKWIRNRKTFSLSIKEIIYAYILFLKKINK